MIEIDNVHKSFGDLEVVKGVSLTVNKGEVVSIIGGSGSGKSTLLMCINGLEPIQKGSIRVDGIEVHNRATDLNRLRQKIGIVFQQWNAFPHLTVLENVMLAPRKVLGKSKAEAEALAVQQLTHVGLGDKLKTFPGKLSGGQQQRVAIARALINQPPILLADEPTGALDSKTGEEILALFKRLRDDGHTVILITHDPEVAAHADRILVMRDGELHEEPRKGNGGREATGSAPP